VVRTVLGTADAERYGAHALFQPGLRRETISENTGDPRAARSLRLLSAMTSGVLIDVIRP
jgi:hypothetical protein